jgi:phosphate-selective porin OprO/OprP
MASQSAARRRGGGVALVALCAAAIPGVASAQDAPIDRIEAIERQIRNLQGELKQLKNELGAAKQQLQQSRSETQRSKEEARQAREAADQARQDAARAASAEAQASQAAAQAQAVAAAPPSAQVAAKGVEVGFPGGRPTISTSDGRMSFAVGMQVQFDTGAYFQNDVTPTTQFPDLNSPGYNLRRGRIFFVAKYDDFTLNITPDFGGSPDGNQTNQTLYEANLNFTGFKPVTATIGYFKPWFSLYDSQSSNDFLLMERPSIIEIARNVAAGDARATAGLKASTDQWFAAWAMTGSQYGAQTGGLLNGQQLSTVGRVAGRPYYDKDWNVQLDFSGEYVFHPNIAAGTGVPVPPNTGVPGVSRTTFNLQDRPELRIDMNRLISTGNLSIANVNVYGGEVGINWRNLLVQGGYYHIGETQSKLPGQPAPNLSFNGGYVEAGWVITGEPIRYNVGAAAFARPKVDDPFIIKDNSFETGIGAWELSARWSVMNLNSNVAPGVSQSVTGGIFGGYQQIFGANLSWYPNDWVRLYLQFQYTQVDKLNSAGTAQIGQKFETLAGRVQVAF